MSLQMLVLLVPVMLGLMGFGLDLGRLYLIRGELTQAAQTMAVAAASKLNGTDQGLAAATAAAQATLDDSTGHGSKYNFGSLLIGQTPVALPGATSRIPYLIIDRFNDASSLDETQQLYRIGAQGLLPAAPGSGVSSATPGTTFACAMATGTEIAWVSAQPPACGNAVTPTHVPSSVTNATCGLF